MEELEVVAQVALINKKILSQTCRSIKPQPVKVVSPKHYPKMSARLKRIMKKNKINKQHEEFHFENSNL
jgi:hypothetical protein